MLTQISTLAKLPDSAAEPARSMQTRYQVLFEHAPYCIYEIDRAGCFVSMNPTWLKMRDAVDVRVIRGTLYLDTVAAADRARVAERMAEAFAGQTQEFEFQDIDGRVFQSALVPLAEANGVVTGLQGLAQDITARKRAELSLQQSQANLSALIENTEASIWAVDTEYRFLVGNARFCENFRRAVGYALQEGDVVLDERLPAEVYNEWRGHYARALRGESFAFETMTHFRSPPVYVEYRLQPIRTAEGKVIGATVLGRNITERKQTEQKLRDAEQFEHAILDALGANICVLDENGVIRMVNRAWREFAAANGGAERAVAEEVNYIAVCDTARGDDAAQAREFAAGIRAVLQGARNEFSIEYPCHAPNEERWFNGRVTRFASQEANWIVVAHENITERKRSEQALRESETRFRVLSENALAGIYTIQDGRLTYMNPAGAKIFGYTPEELTGADPLTVVAPQDHALVTEMIRRRIDGEVETVQYEFRGRCKNGATKEIAVLGVRVILNHRPAILGNLLDITDRKRAEAALRENEKNKQAMFDTMTEGLALNEIVYDENGEMVDYRIVDVNRAFYTTADFRGTRVIGNVATELYGMTRESINAFWHAHRAKNATAFTEMWSPISQRCFFIATSPFVDGKFVTSFLDITELKRSAEALRASEAKLRAVFENSRDALGVFVKGHHVLVNPAYLALFGYEHAEDLYGASIFHLVAPESGTEMAKDLLTCPSDDGAPGTFELTALKKDGTRFLVEVHTSSFDLEGKPAVLGIVRDITERKLHERELQTIADLGAALRTARTRDDMFPVVVEHVVGLLDCAAVSIEIAEPATGVATVTAAYGLWEGRVGARIEHSVGLNAILRMTLKPYHTQNLEGDPQLANCDWPREGLRGGVGVPLVAQRELIGYMWVGRQTEIAESEIRLLVALSDIAANAFHRAALHEQIVRDAAELQLAYDTTLEGWAHALELRDQDTEGHTRRVVKMTLALAEAMGVDKAEMENIRRGALLHDIGKMGIPDSILLKPGTLNEREWEIMQRHPEYAYNFLAPIAYLRKALDIPLYHHEKWDGTGYPRRLQGEAIPLAARIFAVVDVWDALRSDRPYRRAWSAEQALAYIRAQAGKHFDPRVVEVFLKQIASEIKSDTT